MGKLIYSMITSLDGYVSDPDGNFGWGAPEEESHEFVSKLTGSVGAYLYGRRMYETMVYWETAHTVPDQPPYILDFARIWQATDKIVYSTTLNEVASERTRIERTFDPAAVRKLKAESDTTSPSTGLSWRRRRCAPGWSMSTSSSSDRQSSAAAIGSSRTMFGSTWNCWTSVGSATGWSTCVTASRTAHRGVRKPGHCPLSASSGSEATS